MNHSNCVISAVGRNSLHRMWLTGECNFDLHLVVYDDSMEEFRGDTEYICHIKGYKLRVIYRYLEMYPELKERYDYFFFPDDDIQMDAAAINALFEAMRRYRLQIAQPALSMSYYTWSHTLQDRYCKLRYINFVEMMVPCFSREALRKVLFTFNENETGWGTETHWPVLIDASQRDMAVIDEVSVVHTRPIQSGQAIHNRELAAYLRKYNLSTKVLRYDCLPSERRYCCDRNTFRELCNTLGHWIGTERISAFSAGEDGYFGYVHFLFLFARMTQMRNYADAGYDLLCKAQDSLGTVMHDMTFRSGICGCCWLIEYLSKEGLIEENPEDLLETVDAYIRQNIGETMSVEDLAGIGRYYLAKMQNRPTKEHRDDCERIAVLLQGRMGEEAPSVTVDALTLMQVCGMETRERLRVLERKIERMECTQVERVYMQFHLYLLTHDGYFLARVQEGMKNLRPQLMTLEDAVMLVEIMYHTVK